MGNPFHLVANLLAVTSMGIWNWRQHPGLREKLFEQGVAARSTERRKDGKSEGLTRIRKGAGARWRIFAGVLGFGLHT